MGIAYNTSIATDGLFIYYDPSNTRCYSGSATTSNNLVGLNNGNLTNGVGFTSENSGSFTFDGTNDNIIIPNFSVSGSFSVEICCNAANLSTTYVMVGKYGGGGYDFWIGVSGTRFKFSISLANKIEPQTEIISPNTWYHICAVYNSSAITASIYLNGILAQTSNGSSIFQNPPGDYAIGAFGANGGYYFPGKITCHKYYNRALSAAEVKQNYNALRDRFGI